MPLSERVACRWMTVIHCVKAPVSYFEHNKRLSGMSNRPSSHLDAALQGIKVVISDRSPAHPST